jgi:hypothetical protein
MTPSWIPPWSNNSPVSFTSKWSSAASSAPRIRMALILDPAFGPGSLRSCPGWPFPTGPKKLQENPNAIDVALPPKAFFLACILIPGGRELRCPKILLQISVSFGFFSRKRYTYYNIQVSAIDMLPHLPGQRSHKIPWCHSPMRNNRDPQGPMFVRIVRRAFSQPANASGV